MEFVYGNVAMNDSRGEMLQAGLISQEKTISFASAANLFDFNLLKSSRTLHQSVA